MAVLRFIWQRVLAFDRVGSRIPQLVQIWLVEMFFALPLAFFIGKSIDIRGAFGVPGTGEKLDGTFWGALVVALIAGFFFVRSLVKPRLVEGSWAPVVKADVGDFTVFGSNERARVNYVYLTSHPSYALLLLITAPIPAVMALATINQGDSTFYWRITGIVGLIILAFVFKLPPGKPPVDVMLTIIAVVAASATLQASGGLEVLLLGAEKLLRRNPKYVSILAPFVTCILTMLCGTGHVVYTMLPIIYDIAIKNDIRPERPMAASSIASTSCSAPRSIGRAIASRWTRSARGPCARHSCASTSRASSTATSDW